MRDLTIIIFNIQEFSSEKSNAQGEANQSKKIDENNFLNQIRRKVSSFLHYNFTQHQEVEKLCLNKLCVLVSVIESETNCGSKSKCGIKELYQCPSHDDSREGQCDSAGTLSLSL